MPVHAFLSLLKPHTVNRSGARYIHDPSDHRSVGSIVVARSSPHCVKDVQSHLFGRFAIVCDSHGQSKNDSMGAVIQAIQSALITRGDGLDQFHPLRLEYKSPRLIRIKHIAEDSLRSRAPIR